MVIVFCDDLGYGDPSCYGGKVPTPNIDRIAREGIRFTDFHVPHPVCSASRAALLTGCYSPRVSIHGALAPSSTHGIASTETTLAELEQVAEKARRELGDSLTGGKGAGVRPPGGTVAATREAADDPLR